MDDEGELNAAPATEYGNSGGELASPKDKADEENDITEQTEEKKPRLTRHQKATFVSTLLAALATTMAFSILSVFFPLEAKGKGMSQTTIGVVFSTFAVSSGIASPLWGKLIPTLGARFVFLAGGFVSGGCNILFGFIIYINNEATFTAFSILLRFVEGLGSSATFTASAAVMAYSFPDHVGMAVSAVEMTGGLAYAIGPAIGGLLYQAGGFKLPFFVLGGFVLAVDFLNFFLMPQQGSRKDESGPMLKVLSIPAVCVALAAVVMSAVAMASIDPTVSIHLKEAKFTVIQISLLFLGFGLAYSIFSVIWGALADAKKATRTMITLGALGSAVFFFLLGPSPWLKMHVTKLGTSIVYPFGSIMLGLISIPTFVDMYTSTQWYGIPPTLALTAVISGLWTAGFSLGTLVGPILGGALVEAYGFGYETTIIAGIFVVIMIGMCLFGAWEYRCGRGRRVPRSRLEMEANTTEDEQKPLVSDDNV